MSRVRNLAKRGAMLALEHYGPDLLRGAGKRAGKALGLVPSEHREQVAAAVAATGKAAAGARDALSRRDCAGAFEDAAAARAFATVAVVEARDGGGGGKARRLSRGAVHEAQAVHREVLAACEIVPRRGLPPRQDPVAPELPPAAVSGLRRRHTKRRRR